MDSSKEKSEVTEDPRIVSRQKWKAEKPKEAETTKNFPLPYLVLMHTNTPVCTTQKECKRVVRGLQKKHMDEGAPDINHNYLISIDGTVYEGRSPRMVGMTYGGDDENLTKADNNSINIAYIDNGEESLNGVKLHSAVTYYAVAAKLIRENIINADADIIWFDQRKKKKKLLSLSERMDKYRFANNKVNAVSSDPSPETEVSKRKNKIRKKKVPKDIKETVRREDIQGPFVLEPHHIRKLIDRKDRLGREENERDRFF